MRFILLERIASLESELESERGKASSMDDKVHARHKRKFPTKQLDNARRCVAHVVGQKCAVGSRISKQTLFIQGLCKVKGLLCGISEQAVCFPLQRSKVKELRRGCGLFLFYKGSADCF